MSYLQSVFFFVAAGLCEIGGGYLVWISIRERKGLPAFLAGAAVLVLYGVLPTLQPAHFARVYAAYGGVFIVLSLAWGWKVERIAPDRFDIVGAVIAILGAGIIMFWPRK